MSAAYMHCNNHIFWHADLTNSYVPPKRSRAAERRYGVRNGLEEKEVKKVDSGYLGKEDDEKDEPTASDKGRRSTMLEEANKATRLSRLIASPRISLPPRPDLKASPTQVLKFLLSDAALEICRPADEVSDLSDRGDIITYSSLITPFEELLCAVILSRPISHHLGLRTIRTLLNPPYSLRDPVAIKTAGPEKVLEALEAALTQHKGKIADEITLLADAVSSNEWHNDLERLRTLAKKGAEAEREVLRRSIKGLGKTGLEIFYRRVQWQWEEAYPLIDQRTQQALEKMGLPRRAEGLERMIEVRWRDLGFEKGSERDVEERRRRAFVVLLERAMGADLEGKVDEIVEEAAML
ncbi:hypothetical protein DE146DRAFT_662670 [Phaeosphaeria sp. MPI-PUGE-AT-0046c]|nr:hypothetical protein DE146DRAFT_662670 [Phaeosphaeria sp. MPI-PUGE-AT-0046c]